MTTHEISAFSSRFEIYFWDVLIQIMTQLTLLRQRIDDTMQMKSNQNITFATITIGLGCIFLGLYIGFLLGYLGF